MIKTYAFLIFAALLSACHPNRNIKIEVRDTDDLYSVESEFPEDQTERVHAYINQQFGNEHLFESAEDRVDKEAPLADGTMIRVKGSNGSLELRLDKKRSSHQSYEKLKKIAEGLKKEIQ